MQRQKRFSPRGQKTYNALKLTGLLGFASVRQLQLLLWENERSANDSVSRLVKHHYLGEAHEKIDGSFGRGNRIVFLTRQGMTWVLERGEVREEDIAYYWHGGDHWRPTYNPHDIAAGDVLCAFIIQMASHPVGSVEIRLDPHEPVEDRMDIISRPSPLTASRLQPDRIFAMKYYDQFTELYLEYDNGTEGKMVWQQKMEKYLRSPEVMQQPGVFVLCVANTPQRMNTLLRWSRNLVDDRFLFSYYKAVCYGYERRGKKLVLTREGNPFGKIWHVVTTEDPRKLFGKFE